MNKDFGLFGQSHNFSVWDTGAKRDVAEGKARIDLIDPVFLEALYMYPSASSELHIFDLLNLIPNEARLYLHDLRRAVIKYELCHTSMVGCEIPIRLGLHLAKGAKQK